MPDLYNRCWEYSPGLLPSWSCMLTHCGGRTSMRPGGSWLLDDIPDWRTYVRGAAGCMWLWGIPMGELGLDLSSSRLGLSRGPVGG